MSCPFTVATSIYTGSVRNTVLCSLASSAMPFDSCTKGEICAGFHRTFLVAVKALSKVYKIKQLFFS